MSLESVVVIGNFDGVHRGHQAVLGQARALADGRGLCCVVLTFDPHPSEVLGRGAPPRLTTLDRRVELLRGSGADEVVVEPFTMDLASWTPTQFVDDLLALRLGTRIVVVGENFRFGSKRVGDFAMLRRLGATRHVQAVAAEVAGDAEGPFSSTRVRDAIAAGAVDRAAYVLGRPHAISGVVEHGDARGRTLGFPTANLVEVEEMLPAHGVYAVRVAIDGAGAGEGEGEGAARLGGVMNVGVRPTIGAEEPRPRIEVHLFDFDADLYGAALRVELVARLRGEQKFAGLGELQAQIAMDVHVARRALRAAP